MSLCFGLVTGAQGVWFWCKRYQILSIVIFLSVFLIVFWILYWFIFPSPGRVVFTIYSLFALMLSIYLYGLEVSPVVDIMIITFGESYITIMGLLSMIFGLFVYEKRVEI